MPARIILADDHRIILDGLEQLLRRVPELEVIACYTTGTAALEAVRKMKPEILILDVSMPEMSGLEVLREIAEQELPTKVILLTAMLEDRGVVEAMELGVWGLVLKESASVRLVHAVQAVLRGERSLDPSLVARAVERMSKRRDLAAEVEAMLSPRETEVVRMVAAGLRNRQIAEQLSITEGTVKSYLHTIYEKLQLRGRVELTLYAHEKGLV
jgi:DNA-binding NarL/FixJ family response regulator